MVQVVVPVWRESPRNCRLWTAVEVYVERERGMASSYVLLTPTPPPSACYDCGAEAPHIPRMERALIWKGTGAQGSNRARPLTCSYSFGGGKAPQRDAVRSAKTRPHSLLRAREVRGAGPQRREPTTKKAQEAPSPADNSIMHIAPVTTEDDLETLLRAEDDRAATAARVSGAWLDDDADDIGIEILSVASPRTTAPTPPPNLRCRSAFSPPPQPPSGSSVGDPVTPFTADPSCSPMAGAAERPAPPQHDEQALALERALKAHGIEGSAVAAVRRLGIRRIRDLGLLRAEDLEGASASGLNVLERRLLRAAIESEAAAARRCREDVVTASRTWSRLTDDRGWYPPPFSTEPPGLRVTVLEPADISGTVFELQFGPSRTSLAGGASRWSVQGNCTVDEGFELRLRLGRSDRTELDESSGRLSFNVVGVSRNHAEIVLTCGDGQPSTCRVADLGSTNGTFLTRPASSTAVGNSPAAAGADSDDDSECLTFRRPGTSSDSLLERRVDAGVSSDASGIPYLRLGPKLCLGLSLLRASGTAFHLRDVQVVTERLYSESQLRGLGWGDACLAHVLADKRGKARVHAMLDKFAAGSRAVARRNLPAAASPRIVPLQPSPPSVQLSRDAPSDSQGRKTGAEQQHIFLSYQWDCQPIVKRVSEELKARGYSVWLDLEQMHGEMNQRMAEAVEGAAVVCPFISRRYKSSANCMKELNFSDQLGKNMLPIIVDDFDRKEMLRGAVGLITSNLIYVDLSPLAKTLSSSSPISIPQDLAALFDAKMLEIEKALGSRGKQEAPTPPASTGHCASHMQHDTAEAGCAHPAPERQQCADTARGSVGGAKALPALPKIV